MQSPEFGTLLFTGTRCLITSLFLILPVYLLLHCFLPALPACAVLMLHDVSYARDLNTELSCRQ